MKSGGIYFSGRQFILMFFVVSSIVIPSGKLKINPVPDPKVIFTRSDYPVDFGKTLVYESDFGETVSTIRNEDGSLTYRNESDDFKYVQKILVKDDGLFVEQTYQKLDVFLFIKKESTVSYDGPLIRIPFPLHENESWTWEGTESFGDRSHQSKITGKVLGVEKVETPAGTFNTVKIETTVWGRENIRSRVTEWFAPGIGMVKTKAEILGGGFGGFVRDILGYGEIEFVLKEIKTNK